MRQLAHWGASLLGWTLVLLTCCVAQEWPPWRGHKRDGDVVGVKLPLAWPKQLERQWQVEVGQGHASPVVNQRRIFVFARRGEDEVLVCLNPSDGKELWRRGYPAPYQVNAAAAAHGKGPRSTPVVAGGRVITLGISGILTCWDAHNGKTLWQRDFTRQFTKTSPLNGAAMSPVVEDDRCIVHAGGHDKGALLAVDVKTGETIWTSTEDGPGYASPIVTTLDDVRQVVTQSQRACLGVDLEDGKLLWKIPFSTEYDQNSVTPVVHEGSVIFSGINKGVDRYRIENGEDEWETSSTWENKEVSLFMSSPVVDGQRLFGFSHRHKGQLFAIDLTTGKTLWTSEGRLGDNAAIVKTGKTLWALTTHGELIVFKASDKQFQELAHYKVADTPTWAHPVVSSSGVLIKDESKLTFWQLPKLP